MVDVAVAGFVFAHRQYQVAKRRREAASGRPPKKSCFSLIMMVSKELMALLRRSMIGR